MHVSIAHDDAISLLLDIRALPGVTDGRRTHFAYSMHDRRTGNNVRGTVDHRVPEPDLKLLVRVLRDYQQRTAPSGRPKKPKSS